MRITPSGGFFVAALVCVLACACSVQGQVGCTQWALANPVDRPPPRYAHMMAYDSARRVVVLFGGNLAGGTSVPPTYSNDTWEYNGVNWVQRNIPNPPPVRGTGVMVYDSARHVCVLFGGQNTGGRLGDLWEYDGTQWVQRFSGGAWPAVRLSHFMAFDSNRNVTVMYGGFGGSGQFGTLLGDTWEWNGVYWTQVFPAVSPAARVSGAMDYDDVRGRVVMFGGGGDFRATSETWEYDGTGWSLRFSNVDFWRITPAMCFDKARGVSQAFGGILGNIRYADEFEWDGVSWDHFDIPGPAGRSDSLMAYDSFRRRAVLFGGESSQPARLNDTWELVNLNPIIVTSSPASVSVNVGGSAVLAVTATGIGLSYQWRRDGVPIDGAILPTLAIGGASVADRGVYDVLISNACGTTNGGRATLTVGAGACRADVDGNGVLDPDDLAVFITGFFTVPPPHLADFNGDGRVNPDDLGDFITAFFTGC